MLYCNLVHFSFVLIKITYLTTVTVKLMVGATGGVRYAHLSRTLETLLLHC